MHIREPFEVESFKDRDIKQLMIANCSNESDKQSIARAKGLLPYGQIGDAIYAKEKQVIEHFEQQLPILDQLPSKSIILNIGEYQLSATLDQLTENGRFVKQVSKPYAGDYIDLWLNHLCLNAEIKPNETNSIKHSELTQTLFYSPEISFQLNTVEDAELQLKILLDLYWSGLHFPLAFFPKSSFALYSKTGKPNTTDMNSKWNGNDQFVGEKDVFEHCLLHRHLEMNKDQQSEEFLQTSAHVFESMFQVYSEL